VKFSSSSSKYFEHKIILEAEMSTRQTDTQTGGIRRLADSWDREEIYDFPVAFSSEHLRELGVLSASYFLEVNGPRNGIVVFERETSKARKIAVHTDYVLVDFDQRKIWFLTGRGEVSDVHAKEDQAALLERLSAMGDQSPLKMLQVPSR
jgi:hypothetical protein